MLKGARAGETFTTANRCGRPRSLVHVPDAEDFHAGDMGEAEGTGLRAGKPDLRQAQSAIPRKRARGTSQRNREKESKCENQSQSEREPTFCSGMAHPTGFEPVASAFGEQKN